MTRIPLRRHKLLHKALVTRTPTNWQSSPQLFLNTPYLLVEFASGESVDGAGGYGVHGGVFEETDGFFDVRGLDGWGEDHLGEGLGDADDGFKLTGKFK